MEAWRDEIILGSVVVYMAACVLIGLWALGRTRTTRDFFVAGRSLGVVVAAFAGFASVLSGFGFVGGPGLVYRMGSSSIWILGTAVIGNTLIFVLVGKRLRLLAELKDSVSLPDIVEARYRSRSVRLWTAVAIILGVVGYLATQILAMAIVLQGIIGQAVVADIGLGVCVALACSVLVFYSVTGGIVASVYTDVLQGAIMLVAALLVFATALSLFGGGLTEISQVIYADDPEAIGPWGTIGIMGCLSWFFVFGFGLVGQPHVITKTMMLRKVADIRHVIPLMIAGYVVTSLLWIGIGVAMRAQVLAGGHPALARADEAAPAFLQAFAHPLLAGVVFAALLAAIMSTADAFLSIGTAAIVHDIPMALRRHSLPDELRWARMVTVLLAVVAALFALYSGDLVALLGAFGWGTFAAALGPVVAIGLNWKRATPLAANAAIISSLALNFGVKLADVRLPMHVDVGAVSLALSLVLFLGISMLQSPPRLDPEVEAVMDM